MAFLQELRSALLSQTSAYNTLVATNVTLGLVRDDEKALAEQKKKENLALIKTRLNGLGEIWAYVQAGTWSTNKDFVQRIVYLTENDRKTAIRDLGLSGDNHANTLFYRANKILTEKFGSSLIKDILGTDPEPALLKFRLQAGISLSETCFVQEARDLLPIASKTPAYKLSDCVTEAKFLAFYSKAVLDKRFAALDKDKLAYLLFVISTPDSSYSSDQLLMAKILNGECSASVLSETISNPLQDFTKSE